MLITTEAVVAEIKNEDDSVGAGAAGAMGGMPGMM
jgi:hypothetical protein